MQSDTIKILIADDHALMREGTRRIIEEDPGLEVIAEACDGEEAVALATKLTPDVAIVDITMPKLDGIEATQQIKKLCPNVNVLILTAYNDDQFIFKLLEAGAAGYMLKSIGGNELVEAVKSVHAGESVLHPMVARKVFDYFKSKADMSPKKEPFEILSEREKDILRLATRGLSNKEIADELCLSTRTIHGHLRHIFNKLQVSSRTEAVVRGLKEGWVNLSDIP